MFRFLPKNKKLSVKFLYRLVIPHEKNKHLLPLSYKHVAHSTVTFHMLWEC